MPNTYVNKVELANGETLIDITDTTATTEDVISGKVFYDAAGVRTVGSGSAGVQSDWEEDDSTDLAYVQNRPAIRAGDGENSIVEGQTGADSTYGICTLTISGEASTKTFTYTTNDTVPIDTFLNSCIAIYSYNETTSYYRYIDSIDDTNNTITLNGSLSSSSITNGTLVLKYGYKMAIDENSHAEGGGTIACGSRSHAEGNKTFAFYIDSHAEGSGTRATGSNGSHAEGRLTNASGSASHAEGTQTQAKGARSHAEGFGTIANHRSQHVFGEFNIEDPSTNATGIRGNYIEIVGNGASSVRSNARTLDWDGNEALAGKLTVGTDPTNNMDVATKQYVDNAVSGGGGASTLAELTDTTISNPSDGQMLKYNATTGKWVNVAPVTYTLSLSNNVITLAGSDGSTSSITLPVYDGSVTTGGGS